MLTPLRMTLILAVLLVGIAAQSVPILTNLPPTNDNISDNVFGGPAGVAYGFTIGSTAFTLTSMSFRLQTQNGARPSLAVYSNASNNPGAVLFSGFSTPTFTDNVIQTYAYPATSSFVLAANTTYWFVLTYSSPSNGNLFAYGSSPPKSATGGGATLAGVRDAEPPTPLPPSNPSTLVPSFELDGIPGGSTTPPPTVPVPPSVMLGITGLLGVGLYRARYRLYRQQ